jgi:hypothetical protein
MLVGARGFGSLVIYYLALKGSGELKPGDDAVEPMALMVAPFVINAGYTLGWFVELALRALLPLQVNKSTLGPALMKAGVAFSLLAATLPAAIWVTIWLARELHGGR